MATKKATRRRAENIGLTITWMHDDDADLSWLEPGETVTEVLGCIVKDRHGDTLASLWGITDPDDAYARSIEDELLAESIHEIRSSLFEAI